jgi:hypothetical protein
VTRAKESRRVTRAEIDDAVEAVTDPETRRALRLIVARLGTVRVSSFEAGLSDFIEGLERGK